MVAPESESSNKSVYAFTADKTNLTFEEYAALSGANIDFPVTKPRRYSHNLKTAIVHDWLVTYGGAEVVLEKLLQLYPQADLFSLIDFLPADKRGFILDKPVKTSFIQKLPFAQKQYRKYLPFMPVAVERLDLSEYDLIISSSYAVAKGILTRPDQLHISYLQARNLKYAYEDRLFYKKDSKRWLSFMEDFFLSYIRLWDSIASRRPDFNIVNSRYVQDWYAHRHAIKTDIIYPPVNVDDYARHFSETKENYYVTVGRLEPYKRLDLAIKVFNELKLKLVVIGDGTERETLQNMAGSNIEFLGFQNKETIAKYLSKAKAFVFPSREDFGIAPLEAQACGTPVIALAKGGALETVIGLPISEEENVFYNNSVLQTNINSFQEASQNQKLRQAIQGKQAYNRPTGLFFREQTAESLKAAIHQFENFGSQINPLDCLENAKRFSPEFFKNNFDDYVENAIRLFQGEPLPLGIMH